MRKSTLDINKHDSDSEAQPLLSENEAEVVKPVSTRLPSKKTLTSAISFTVAVVLAIILFNVNIFENAPSARRALSLFVFVAILWATEAIPIYTTSLLIPPLIVMMKILVDEDRNPLPAPAAAKAVTSLLFSGTVLVAFGAFTMSLALAKYNLSYRLAAFVLAKVGKKPAIVMLTVMFLSLFLCMWMNNVAAPVVCMSLIQPMLQEFDPSEPYIKALLLGIAYASNIGGMTTPIASPQNLVAVHTIESTTWVEDGVIKKGDLTWGELMGVSMPFTIICTLIVWGFLWIFYRPTLTEVDPLPPRTLEPFSVKHAFVVVISISTVVLWAVDNQIENFVGNPGIVALLPVVMFFSSGILEKKDFKELSWDVLMLLAGGLALGEAISNSGLLKIMADGLAEAVSHSSPWVVLLTFSSFIWLFSNFISHTVAAIIVLPVIANVGCKLGAGNCAAGHFRLFVLGAVLVDSGAMGLPVTSFPNAQAFSMVDKQGRRFLSPMDFIKTGFILGIFELIILMSIGYGLLIAIL